jgi:hypothetical protein
MRESRLSGSVRGATRNGRLYRDWESSISQGTSHGFGLSRLQIVVQGYTQIERPLGRADFLGVHRLLRLSPMSSSAKPTPNPQSFRLGVFCHRADVGTIGEAGEGLRREA